MRCFFFWLGLLCSLGLWPADSWAQSNTEMQRSLRIQGGLSGGQGLSLLGESVPRYLGAEKVGLRKYAFSLLASNTSSFLENDTLQMLEAPCSWGVQAQSGCVATSAKKPKKKESSLKEAPPSEWPLLLVMGFSGVIVSAVMSFASQSVIEAIMVSPSNPTTQSRLSASVVYTVFNIAVIPWLVTGTMYGLSRLSNNYRSNFWWMLLGAYLGQTLSAGISLLASFLGSGADRFAVARIVTLFADGLFAAVGALLAYIFVRKPYEDVETLGSLLRYQNGRVRWGIPLPLISQDAQEQRVSVSLLSGHF